MMSTIVGINLGIGYLSILYSLAVLIFLVLQLRLVDYTILTKMDGGYLFYLYL